MSKSFKKNADRWGNDDDDRYERRRIREVLREVSLGEDDDVFESELYREDKRPEKDREKKAAKPTWVRDTTKRSFDDA